MNAVSLKNAIVKPCDQQQADDPAPSERIHDKARVRLQIALALILCTHHSPLLVNTPPYL